MSSYDFFNLASVTGGSQAATYAASSRATGGMLTPEELEELGVTVKDEENDFGLNFEDFLQLMVQQLQNQTIDNTTDTNEMMNQLVQMSSVQAMSQMNTNMETLVEASTLTYAASLVDKTVTVAKYVEDEDGNITIEEVVGTVTGTGTYQGVPVIFVDGEMYALSDIMAVGTLPEVPEEGDGTEGDGNTDQGTEGTEGTEEA